MQPTTPPTPQHLTKELENQLLQLLKEGNYKAITPLLGNMHPADIADFIGSLRPDQRPAVAHLLEKETLGGVLTELSEGVQENLLQSLNPEALVEAVAELESDDVADIVQNMEEEQAEETLSLISNKKQKKLTEYDPDTAGGLMQLESVVASPEETVKQVLSRIKKEAATLPDNIGDIFVLGTRQRLLGKVNLNELVKQSPSATMESLMKTDLNSVLVGDSRKDVISLFAKYHLRSCPVTSRHGYLLGRITIDDILEAVMDEQEQEARRSVGVEEGGDIFAPLGDIARTRLPWLVVNLFTAVVASAVIAMFEGEIQQLVALAVLMPIVASMGGNAGTQTLTVTVRGLAMKQVTLKNAWYILRRELLIGSLNGVVLGVFLALGTFIFYQNTGLGWVILAATFVNHILASIAGYIVPVLLQKWGKDPAVSAGVLVTTVTDVGGFFAFLGLAAVFLL